MIESLVGTINLLPVLPKRSEGLTSCFVVECQRADLVEIE